MDGTSNLAIQYVDDYTPSYAPPSAPEREHLPAPAPLAMPKQSLGPDGKMSERTPEASPADIARRRLILFTATFALAALASWVPFRLYADDGFLPLEIVGLALFEVLILAISCWFCSAVAGLTVLIRRGGKDELNFAATPPRPTVRTALLMPLYNEDAQASFGRLAQIEASLSRLGVTQHFDLFVLSDTTDERVATAEWNAFQAFRPQSNCRVYYRRRRENTERKVGNLSEWIRRFGAAYSHMIVLDADSTMSGETILHMVDAMERHPTIGLIQTTPTIVKAQTLFGRASQFGVRLYGRVASAGLAWWSGSEGSYWGHNAIVRVRAFADSCGLPSLPGRKPFGGHIMSHDVVEAGLLRRAGWGVHVTPTLGGSHEETPPSILEFMKRERRWCQGNLQHIALIGAPGLHWMSRFQMAVGLMAYLASPLWLASLVVGLMIQVGNKPDWGTWWYFLVPEYNPLMWATVLTVGMLLGPKLMGFGLAFFRPEERRAFGGGKAMLKSMATEMALSALTAPIYMIGNTRAVFQILLGKDAGWAAQNRDADGLSREDAKTNFRNEFFAGLFFTVALLPRPDLLLWVWPIVVPLLFAPQIAAWTSQREAGLKARAAGLLATPEELAEQPEAPVGGEVVALPSRAARQALFEAA
ncbi:glucans biosynthesis glucosyltransferase MdoH [Caulobacter mirabilis]|uniref:Glucans biosynthesis glucosyltransferase H n=1 Tax=Caulobacter mirabilis TaxID=69666 RepID=A0A2D2AWK4_9CAUL|nr:glucans biosynthesis glucosyltransferase MdoH [Caulobacter mirabilis]ATQ42355.1 glucans biosynthesis glucosyltransferase MdoH [Caulobacter mirabilis]